MVNGILFELNTDFRIWVKIGKLMKKLETAKDEESNAVFVEICNLAIYKYPESGYVLGDELLYGLMDFYKGFPDVDNGVNKKKKERAKEKAKAPSFDFANDAI